MNKPVSLFLSGLLILWLLWTRRAIGVWRAIIAPGA